MAREGATDATELQKKIILEVFELEMLLFSLTLNVLVDVQFEHPNQPNSVITVISVLNFEFLRASSPRNGAA